MDDVKGKAECDAAWTHVNCCGDVGRDNELADGGDNGRVVDTVVTNDCCGSDGVSDVCGSVGCIEDADDENFGISFTFRGSSGFDFYKQLELWYSAW